MIEGLLVAAIVGAAALYLGRRAWAALSGRSCGCGRKPGGQGCPAASLAHADLERLAREAGRSSRPSR